MYSHTYIYIGMGMLDPSENCYIEASVLVAVGYDIYIALSYNIALNVF